ncbi:BHLH domain-containing protein [Caerostris extrusa]|uniref:BHLH domain-containing protein n=1 Tax=Caerostris extrusa TaxID=172846 RepID=A0AAV4SFD0_CAEEX|nr:BHLH domain-containing protein [Caerostris extrusa]
MSETSQASSDNEKSKRPCGSRRDRFTMKLKGDGKIKSMVWISKIGELLPSKEPHKQSKISILEQTVEYIKLLVSEREKLLSEKLFRSARVDSAIQVNTDLSVNIPNANSSNGLTLGREPPKKAKSNIKNSKTKSLKKTKNVNLAPSVAIYDSSVSENIVHSNSCVDINLNTSLSTSNASTCGNQISQGSVLSSMTCNDIAKEAPSVHAEE